MDNNTVRCKNCNHEFTLQFCNNCGQKQAHRIDLAHVQHELVHVFTHTDKGIFALIPLILTKAGLLAKNYVEGKRKRYFNIFQYLIIIVGVTTLIMSKSNAMTTISESLVSNSTLQSERISAVQKELLAGIQQYLNLFLFSFIPVYAFFTWLFFRKKGYNYAENFVLQVSIQAQLNTYSLLLLLPMVIFGGKQLQFLSVILGGIFIVVSNTIANRQFFRVGWLRGFFVGLMVVLLTYLAQIIVVTVITLYLLLR